MKKLLFISCITILAANCTKKSPEINQSATVASSNNEMVNAYNSGKILYFSECPQELAYNKHFVLFTQLTISTAFHPSWAESDPDVPVDFKFYDQARLIYGFNTERKLCISKDYFSCSSSNKLFTAVSAYEISVLDFAKKPSYFADYPQVTPIKK